MCKRTNRYSKRGGGSISPSSIRTVHALFSRSKKAVPENRLSTRFLPPGQHVLERDLAQFARHLQQGTGDRKLSHPPVFDYATITGARFSNTRRAMALILASSCCCHDLHAKGIY